MADAFITALMNGDIIGFVISCYTSSMGQGFYAFVLLIVFGTLYNRTRSLGLCIVIWLLLGSTWMIAAAETSMIAVILVVLGIAGIIWKAYTMTRKG